MSPTRLAWRQLWRGTAIWAGVMAALIGSGASTYASIYPDAAARQGVAVQMDQRSFVALYGIPTHLDTAGGFVAWRYGLVASVMVAVWALLAVSRIARGDEERGRVDLLLAAPLGPAALVRAQATGFAVAVALVGLAVFAGAAGSRLALGGSAILALAIAGGAACFGGIAAVTSQLLPTRRRASGWAGAILGGSYLLRAVGDTSEARAWLSWLSPVGWVGRVDPFGEPSVVAAVLPYLVGAGGFVLAARLSTRRDVGAGILADTASGAGRARPVRSPLALAWRLSRGVLVAWSAGMAVGGLVMGFISSDVSDVAAQDANIAEMMSRLGGASVTSAAGFVGLVFGVMAAALGLYAGSQVVMARDEEATGRLDALLAGGCSRSQWLLGRLLVAGFGTAVLAVVVGVSTWAGVRLSGSAIDLPDVLRGAGNVLPAALLLGAFTAVVFSVRPTFTAAAAYGSVTAGYLLLLAGSLLQAPGWVLDLSPFTHVAPVPALPPNTGALVIMVVLVAVFVGVATSCFARRDLRPD